jgi:hypothetical protein
MSAPFPDVRIAAAHRVIKGCDTAPRVREVAGAVEVVAVRRGRLCRHIIDQTGRARLVETSERPGRWRLGRCVLLAGVLGFLGIFLAPLFGLKEGDARLWIAALGALAAWWGGAWIQWTASKNSMSEFREHDGWSELKSLGLPPGKPPLTWLSLAQLCAVERLAVERGDEAVVRQQPDGGAEVVTGDRQVLERHLVGRDGSVALMDSARWPRRFPQALKRRAYERYGAVPSGWTVVDLRPSD